MSPRIAPRVARAKPTEEQIRVAALAGIETRRGRIAAATAKLEVPASKNHTQFAAPPLRRHPPILASGSPNPGAYTEIYEFLLLTFPCLGISL